MTTLFNGTEVPEAPEVTDDGSAFDQLVGEGKKYRDNEALAKAIIEKDRFIDQLKSETAGLRQDLQEKSTIEELMTKLDSLTQGNPPVPSNDGNPPVPNSNPPSNSLKHEDIQNLVKQTLTQETQKALQERNIKTVEDKLKETWGPNYLSKLKAKQAELGETPEYLESLAGRNPKAFFKLLDIESVPSSNPNQHVPPANRMRTDAPKGMPKKFSDFSKLRKANPSEYWSPRVQNEMLKLTQEYGDAFLKS